MVDAASGGVFVDKTPVQARNRIESMAANSQQFGTNRSDPAPRKSSEVNVSSLEQQLSELTSLVRHMVVGNGQIARVCGICTQVGHATDMCSILQEGSAEQVNATRGFPGPPQQKYDPYSNTYNPGWTDHPNLRYGNPPANQSGSQAQLHNQAYRPPYHPPPQHPQIPTPGEFLENIVKDLATNTMSFQQETRASIQHLNTQTVVNPKENVSAITSRSGRELHIREGLIQEPVGTKNDKELKVEESEPIPKETPRGKFPSLFEYKHVSPFPMALKDSRKDEGIKELYETFRRCKGCKRVELGEQVSAIIQRKVPTKCKDPGPLNETAIVIQMADKSTIFPKGLLEDVLVQVGELVFPDDFYVLDMKNNELNSPILLGRPFLKTSKSIIDVDNGTLTMKFDGEIAKFNIFDTLKTPKSQSVVNFLDVNDHVSQGKKKLVLEDKLKETIATPAEIFLSDMQPTYN
ncbi:uncharacterized protein [Henckelia pumila]|uniref:uncharacterized protein n=1 Tax=Henckelia pumila TaxID=405737 RepID=UPI003C6DEDB3